MTELESKINEVTDADILDALKAGAELYTSITESFVTEFVFMKKHFTNGLKSFK